MLESVTGVKYTIAGKEVWVNRPEPILPDSEVALYKRRFDPQEAVEVLIGGHYVLVDDYYSSGLSVLNALKHHVNSLQTDQSYQEQSKSRTLFHELSQRLLLFVSRHKLKVKKAPEIGWLKTLYPEMEEFLLPFPQVQGLNSSWQWYLKGLSVPRLQKKIHPFFGTYFPTRFEHLKLFDKWLEKYPEEKNSAIDVGIGAGVLTFLMMKHGFKRLIGTDSNPNAIIGLHLDLNKTNQTSDVELLHGDLFAGCELQTELIVFNPPWLPASHQTHGIDKAIFYDDDLFPRFFLEAQKRLIPGGRVVLLFSNLGQTTKVTTFHPIEDELARGGRFQKELLLRKDVAPASTKTRRNQNWRSTENVELWVLKLKGE